MTPRDLFRFYAKLRTNKSEYKFDIEIEPRIDEMIELLGLEKCKDTIVGDSFNRGLSGGEKKRTNIGIELI